jgi:TPR repeat protein
MDVLKEHYRLHEDEQDPVNIVDGTNPLFSHGDEIGGARARHLKNGYSVAKGIRSCRRSAETKLVSAAAFKLGSRSLITKDVNKAFKWYLRAAVLDHSGAQYNLGLMCLKGEGVSQDAVAGLSWIEVAADNGDKGARELLQRIDQALVAK